MKQNTTKRCMLKGHEKPITKIEFTREGDYFISCSADKTANLWNGDNFEFMGKYLMNGAVSDCSISKNGEKVIFSTRDSTYWMFNFENGKEIISKQLLSYSAPMIGIEFNKFDDKFFGIYSSFSFHPTSIHIIDTEKSLSETYFENEHGQFTRAVWGPSYETIIAGDEFGKISFFDVKSDKQIDCKKIHSQSISDIQIDDNRLFMCTTSHDGKCNVYDFRKIDEPISTFTAGYILNAVALAPYEDYIVVAGGQQKDMVTKTQNDTTMLMATFVNMINGDEICRISGHFGNINSIKFSPNGKKLVTAADDGYIHINLLENEIFH